MCDVSAGQGVELHTPTILNLYGMRLRGLSQRNNIGFCGYADNTAVATAVAHSSAFERQSFLRLTNTKAH